MADSIHLKVTDAPRSLQDNCGFLADGFRPIARHFSRLTRVHVRAIVLADRFQAPARDLIKETKLKSNCQVGGRPWIKLLTLAVTSTAMLIGSFAPVLAQKTALSIGSAATDIGPMDPHVAASNTDRNVVAAMFNGLVRFKPGLATFEGYEPDLAQSWTSNESKTEWAFTLRQGVQCHRNYGEFTAEDAAYSLLRSADPKRSGVASDYAPIAKAEAIDRYTLKVTLKAPIPSLLGLVSNYAGGFMVCKKAAEEEGGDFRRKPIGTGPFMFEEYKPQQYVKLVANKSYFRGVPKLDSLAYRFIPSDASRDLAFETGEIDMLFGKQDEAWLTRMKRTVGTVAVAMEPAELSWLNFNVTVKPLDDIRVRRAMLLAIDRDALTKFRGPNANKVAVSVIPSSTLGAIDLHLPAPNLAEAKKLLAEAGYPDGLTVKIIATDAPIFELVQANLRKIGVKLDVQTVDLPTYHVQIRKDLSPLVMYQAARFPVADVFLTQFYHSRSTVGTPTAVTNFSHCSAADKEIDEARTEPDQSRQKQLWAEAQRKILDAVCSAPIYESFVLLAYRDSLDLGYELKGSMNLGPPMLETTHFTK
ncbi:polyamine ABC transporter substrate-binding protein [Bradyrhizobium arachidis]|uniref:ABC transporter substrate-binding protein n=1 Tax=Bradyrhizobium arachidis TaxID=858423 RepID=UPI00216208DA|nr:ABC transporter substrate-binding protein [Bradyrhizobium arachidis]UVO35764.1 polyamine ABC transporter substrate-binding protein [Bradyrhizobium arachidis]